MSVSCPTVKLGEKMEREDLNGKFHDSLDPVNVDFPEFGQVAFGFSDVSPLL